MFHTIFDLCFLCIIETVYGTDKISCDPPDPVKFDTLTNLIGILIHSFIPTTSAGSFFG